MKETAQPYKDKPKGTCEVQAVRVVTPRGVLVCPEGARLLSLNRPSGYPSYILPGSYGLFVADLDTGGGTLEWEELYADMQGRRLRSPECVGKWISKAAEISLDSARHTLLRWMDSMSKPATNPALYCCESAMPVMNLLLWRLDIPYLKKEKSVFPDPLRWKARVLLEPDDSLLRSIAESEINWYGESLGGIHKWALNPRKSLCWGLRRPEPLSFKVTVDTGCRAIYPEGFIRAPLQPELATDG